MPQKTVAKPKPAAAEPKTQSPRELVHTNLSTELKSKTRAEIAWVSLGFFAVVLVLLLIFVAQNSTQVKIHYLGFSGSIGFGVAMLLSAIAGIALTLLIGSARIAQLKMRNRKLEK